MAANIPPALKSIDITRFAARAAQVEKAKPVVAYWCNYWIVNQILSKGLHTADDESTTYTMGLMDKLEQTKAEHTQDDAIIDDVAGQAYVEHFGLETFQRADNAVRANKATRQTADTFLAAATFLELPHIWGPLDPDIASKVKFAKYHALRIAKALKAGEDPNLSNPATEPSAEEQPPLDPNDPEVRALNGQEPSGRGPYRLQPSIEEVPDEHHQIEPHLARDSSLDQSLHPSRAPSVPRSSDKTHSPTRSGAPSPHVVTAKDFYNGAANTDVSPIAPSSPAGGGYFPRVPENYSDSIQPALPRPLPDIPLHTSLSDVSAPPSMPTSSAPTDFSQIFPPHPGQNEAPGRAASSHGYQSPSQNSHYTTDSSSQLPYQTPQPPAADPIPHRLPTQSTLSRPVNPRAAYRTDEESVMKAQKHARWAISALNFEDVNTAVKELMGALESLGAV